MVKGKVALLHGPKDLRVQEVTWDDPKRIRCSSR